MAKVINEKFSIQLDLTCESFKELLLLKMAQMAGYDVDEEQITSTTKQFAYYCSQCGLQEQLHLAFQYAKQGVNEQSSDCCFVSAQGEENSSFNLSKNVTDAINGSNLDLLNLTPIPEAPDPIELVQNGDEDRASFSILLPSYVAYIMRYFGFEDIVNEKLKKISPNTKLQYGNLACAYVIHMLCSKQPTLSSLKETANFIPMEILTNSSYPASTVNRYAIARLLDAINDYGAQAFTMECIHEMLASKGLLGMCREGHIDSSYIAYYKHTNMGSDACNPDSAWCADRNPINVSYGYSFGRIPCLNVSRIVVNLAPDFTAIPVYTCVGSGNENDLALFARFAKEDAPTFFNLYSSMSLLVGDSALAKVGIMRALKECGVNVLSRAADSYSAVANAIDEINQGKHELQKISVTLSDGTSETYEACNLGQLLLREAKTKQFLPVYAVGIVANTLFDRKCQEGFKMAEKQQKALNSELCKLFRGLGKVIVNLREAVNKVRELLKKYPLVDVTLNISYVYRFDLKGMPYHKEVCDESNRIYEFPKEDESKIQTDSRLALNFNLDIGNSKNFYTTQASRYKYKEPPPERVNKVHIQGYKVKSDLSTDVDAVKQRAKHECIYVLVNTMEDNRDPCTYYDKYHAQTFVELSWRETKDPDLFFNSPNFKRTDRTVASFYFTSIALFFQRFLLGVFRSVLNQTGIAFSCGDLPPTTTPSWKSMLNAMQYGTDKVQLVVEDMNRGYGCSIGATQQDSYLIKLDGFKTNLFAQALCKFLPGFKEFFNLENFKSHAKRYIADARAYSLDKCKARILDTPTHSRKLPSSYVGMAVG